jgi:hypothetical protein
MYLALQVAVGVVIGLTIFACFAAAIFIWWVGEADLVDQRRAGSPFPENLLSGFAWLLLLGSVGAFAAITVIVAFVR